jgi:O-antigen ligase
VSIVAGFAGVSFQRSLWSTYERMQGIFDQVHWLALVVVAVSVYRTLADWKLLLSANLAVSVVVALVGLAGQNDLIDWRILGSGSRVESTLGNATYVGAYSMVNILIAGGLIAHTWRERRPVEGRETARRRRRRRGDRRRSTGTDYVPLLMGFWLFAIVVDLWALWQSGTRGAVLGLGAGLVAFALAYGLWGQIDVLRKVSYGVFGLALVVLALFIVSKQTTVFDPLIESSSTLTRLSAVSTNDLSIRGRMTSWRAGLRGYLDKPIFGWGPENYLIAWGRYFDSASGVRERFDQAHNKVLEELTTKGAVGAVSYLGIWAAMGWAMVRSIRRRQRYEQVFVALVGAAMVGFFAQNLFLFDSPVTSLQFALLVAFAVGEEMRQRESESDHQGEATAARTGYLTEWFRTTLGSTVGAVLIAVVLALSLLAFNVRAYWAAKTVVLTISPTITWAQRFEFFEESIDDFPGLANYPRQMLLLQVSSNVGRMSEQELEQALALIEREGQDALEDEPESWRVYVLLARFYQRIAQIDARFLEVAREALDQAIRLAPRTLDVEAALRDQEFLEEQVTES